MASILARSPGRGQAAQTEVDNDLWMLGAASTPASRCATCTPGGPAAIERYETVTGHVDYAIRRNFRLLAGATWDMEQESARWTLGLVIAF